MEEVEETNQFENSAFHVEVGGSFDKSCEKLKHWIVENSIKREQIISFSCHETSMKVPDTEVVVYYRKNVEGAFQSLDKLAFKLVRNLKQWDELCLEAQKDVSQGKDVISLTHSPKNIGQLNCYIIWYLPTTDSSACTVKQFSTVGDWNGLLRNVVNYMNSHVIPSQMISLSIFEEDHPCPNQE